tara:strand:- start:327 stop:566 length:240 start_codon:yes stop_codon:yes gene_type:complete
MVVINYQSSAAHSSLTPLVSFSKVPDEPEDDDDDDDDDDDEEQTEALLQVKPKPRTQAMIRYHYMSRLGFNPTHGSGAD